MFISLEGIDRSGKTTQANLLAEALGPETLLFREPGGTEVSERIRAILKDPAIELDERTELLLFCAARAELVTRVIAPALKEGGAVVCDRFVDSTVAYQGVGRGLGVEVVERLNELAAAGCEPDVTFLLRISAEEAVARGQLRLAQGLEDGADRFEAEGIEFQRAIVEAYDEIAARHPERVRVVDASADPDAVHAAIMAELAGVRT